MLAMKILIALGLSFATFLLACLLWFAIAGMHEASMEAFPDGGMAFIARTLTVVMSGMVLGSWLMLNFIMWGRIWFELVDRSKVPGWMVVLFSDVEQQEVLGPAGTQN